MSDVYEFSDGFQLKILALMTRDKAAFVSFRDVLQPKYFRKDIHIDLARIVHEFYDAEMQRAKVRGTPINPPSMEVLFEEIRKLTKNNKIKEKMKSQYHEEILDIMDVDLSDSEYIKDSVVKFGKEAALTHAILESVDILQKGTENFSVIEDKISKAIKVGDNITDLGTDYFETAKERTEMYSKGSDGVRRIPTGMSGIDKVLKGGLGDTELGVIIAPPNRGKSFALINVGAGAVLEGYNVAHYTLEMPESQVNRRYDERLTKKDFEYMKNNSDKILTALLNIQKFNKGRLFTKKFPTNDCNINTIRSHLTRLEMEKGFKPDLIVIDYGDLVQPRKSYSDKRFELESVYSDMRDLGSEYGCPVWTASQANRGSLDKKTITMADLAEAFNKANIADFMLALCQTKEEKENNVLRWHIAKHRDGIANITLDGEVDYATAQMMAYEIVED